MNMQNLMAQAQKMQRDMLKKKEELDAKTFTGKSEWVEVTFSGKRELIAINIKKDKSLDIEDIEMLEDMVKLAIKDSLSKVEDEIKKSMGSMGELSGLM